MNELRIRDFAANLNTDRLIIKKKLGLKKNYNKITSVSRYYDVRFCSKGLLIANKTTFFFIVIKLILDRVKNVV